MKLSEFKKGDRGRVTDVGRGEVAERLRSMGVFVGASFIVVSVLPASKSMAVSFDGILLALRREAAELVEAEVQKSV